MNQANTVSLINTAGCAGNCALDHGSSIYLNQPGGLLLMDDMFLVLRGVYQI